MEWKVVWNGRRILVWNMEDAQNRMEDLKNGMEGRFPYFHTKCKYNIYPDLQQITKNYQTRKRIISHFSVPYFEFLACCE